MKLNSQENNPFLKLVTERLAFFGHTERLHSVLEKQYNLSKRAASVFLHGGNLSGVNTYSLLTQLNLLRNPEEDVDSTLDPKQLNKLPLAIRTLIKQMFIALNDGDLPNFYARLREIPEHTQEPDALGVKIKKQRAK